MATVKASSILEFFLKAGPQKRAGRSNTLQMLETLKQVEQLEPRLMLTSHLGPIDPDSGEANLLDIIESIPLNDIQTALDNYPIPYVVIAQKNGQDPVVENNRAGSPTRVDVDDSRVAALCAEGGHGDQAEIESDRSFKKGCRKNEKRLFP